jgi:hypothetical protein
MRSAMHQRSAVEARRKTGAGAHGFRRLDGSNVGSATPDRKPPRLRDAWRLNSARAPAFCTRNVDPRRSP